MMRALPIHLIFSLLFMFPGAAHAVDRVELSGACHAPVQSTIDPEWRRDATTFKENSLRTFTRYLEDKEAARRLFVASLQICDLTRASAFDVIETTKELLIRGFRGPGLSAVRWAVLDLHAQLGADKAGHFASVLGAVQSRGNLTAEDLKELSEVLGGNLLKDALGRGLGLRGTPEGVRDQVAERLKREPIDAKTAVPAVLDGLLKQVREAQLGDAARAALQTCVGTMTEVCPRKEAEAHCRSTPPEFLEIMRR